MGQGLGPYPWDRGKGSVKRSMLTEARAFRWSCRWTGPPPPYETDRGYPGQFAPGKTGFRSGPATGDVPGPKPARHLIRGCGYDGVRRILEEVSFTAHISGWGEESKAIREEAGLKTRRRVVARTHGWLSRFRRIMVRFACDLIAFRAVGLLGQALRPGSED